MFFKEALLNCPYPAFLGGVGGRARHLKTNQISTSNLLQHPSP